MYPVINQKSLKTTLCCTRKHLQRWRNISVRYFWCSKYPFYPNPRIVNWSKPCVKIFPSLNYFHSDLVSSKRYILNGHMDTPMFYNTCPDRCFNWSFYEDDNFEVWLFKQTPIVYILTISMCLQSCVDTFKWLSNLILFKKFF